MTTYAGLHAITKKAKLKISTGENHLHYVNGVQCITITMDEYVSLIEDRQRLKARKKK